MELKFINYTYKDKNISFDINKGHITGITGSNLEDFLDLISLRQLNKGQLLIDNIKINKDNIYEYKKRISVIDQNLLAKEPTVYTLMVAHIKRHNLAIKDPNKKIIDSLKIVELPEQILTQEITYLSSSEKKLLQLAISLLSNPSLLILNEPFKDLDKHNIKKVIMLLQRLKEQFHKTIIILSNDSNILYKYTEEMLFIKSDDIFLSGPTNEVYLRVDYLKRNKFDIPEIVEFTYIAKKKKNVKIDYHKDVRDIIKDIYKHI